MLQSTVSTSSLSSLHFLPCQVFKHNHVQTRSQTASVQGSRWSEPLLRAHLTIFLTDSSLIDPSSIAPVVQTVNAAFASDPLIRWLRPNTDPNGQSDASAWQWQYRRVQGVISQGMVLRSASVAQMASEHSHKKRSSQSDNCTKAATEESTLDMVSKDSEYTSSEEDAGAVVFLFPPKSHLGWSFASIWLACKLWLLDLFSPVNDDQAKKKVQLTTHPYLTTPADHSIIASRSAPGRK